MGLGESNLQIYPQNALGVSKADKRLRTQNQAKPYDKDRGYANLVCHAHHHA
nr:hypothetical protein [uncultured Campylobacter sp.]